MSTPDNVFGRQVVRVLAEHDLFSIVELENGDMVFWTPEDSILSVWTKMHRSQDQINQIHEHLISGRGSMSGRQAELLLEALNSLVASCQQQLYEAAQDTQKNQKIVFAGTQGPIQA